MSHDTKHYVTLVLMGHTYKVPCAVEENDTLHRAGDYLNALIDDAKAELNKAAASHPQADRLLLMVALNVAVEKIKLEETLTGKTREIDQVAQRLQAMIDALEKSE